MRVSDGLLGRRTPDVGRDTASSVSDDDSGAASVFTGTVKLWWQEAERNRVLPLMAGFSVLYGILPPLPTQTRYTFMGGVDSINWGMIPRIYGRSYAIEADLVVPGSGAEGVIVAMADFIGGCLTIVSTPAAIASPPLVRRH